MKVTQTQDTDLRQLQNWDIVSRVERWKHRATFVTVTSPFVERWKQL
jgi:hypothetical protein